MRAELENARRVVVKVGSSSLTTRAGGIDQVRVQNLVNALADLQSTGRQVVLVSSGAIAAGLAPLGLQSRPADVATQQAAASVGQSLLVTEYAVAFAKHEITVGQVLLTAQDLLRRAHYRNAQRGLSRLLEMGVLPIVNENDTVATDEIRFGDNDRLAALVAQVVQADLLVLLSDVDGLYDGPPSQPGAKFIPLVSDLSELSSIEIGGTGTAGVGSGGMTTKVEAARIATAAGIPVILTSAANASKVVSGQEVGTVFKAVTSRTPTRLLWLAHATTSQGQVVLDAGAITAVVERRLSLLPAGIKRVSGFFTAGDAIDICDENLSVVARGISSFDSEELPNLIGRRTSDLVAELGSGYDREVIHRDDIVILKESS